MLKSRVHNSSKKLWLQKEVSESWTVNSNIAPTQKNEIFAFRKTPKISRSFYLFHAKNERNLFSLIPTTQTMGKFFIILHQINQTGKRIRHRNEKFQGLVYSLLGGFAINFERRGRGMGFFIVVVYKLFLVPIVLPGFSHILQMNKHTHTKRLVLRVSKIRSRDRESNTE